MARFARGPQTLLIVKTDRESLVHRRGAMDCIIVKTHDLDGRVTGERRFAGLFTSTAYHTPVLDVPLLRNRVQQVLRRAGLDPTAMTARRCWRSSNSYPRDELFQIEPDTLYAHAVGILQLQERRRVALFSRRDAVGRFASCLVFAPRERFDAALSARFARILEEAWQGHVTSISGSGSTESPLAQALYTLKLHTPDSPTPDLADLERTLADAATSWNDRLDDALQDRRSRTALARLVPGRLSRPVRCDTSRRRYRSAASCTRRNRVRRPSWPARRHAAASLRRAPVPSAEADRTVRHPAARRKILACAF